MTVTLFVVRRPFAASPTYITNISQAGEHKTKLNR